MMISGRVCLGSEADFYTRLSGCPLMPQKQTELLCEPYELLLAQSGGLSRVMTLPPNAGAAPRRYAGAPQAFSALCWRRHGLRIVRRARGPSVDKDVPPVSSLRTAVSAAREAGRAPRFRALAWLPGDEARPLWQPSAFRADESGSHVRGSARRRSVRVRFFRPSSKTP